MDPNRFDAITRQLGAARSRRGMLKALGAAALGTVGLAGGGHAARAAKDDKVGVCHRTGSAKNPYTYLTVSPNAVPAHASHGDVIDPDFDDDPDNCGKCGNVCPKPANSTATCSNGTCGFTCLNGFADCNGDPADGCETYVAGTDLANCGDCGEICDAPGNATATCSDGECGFTCTSGEPCGEVCLDTSSDPKNCGGCNNVCPGPTSGSGTAICSGSRCDISCGSAHDGFPLTRCNGACVDTRFPENCGACGKVCLDPCVCQQSYNGIFCYSNRTGQRGPCKSNADCTVAGETCQFDSKGRGTCEPIGCANQPDVCPFGSQCTANVYCAELCRAA